MTQSGSLWRHASLWRGASLWGLLSLVSLGGLSVQVSANKGDRCTQLGLVSQLVAKEDHRCANDDHPLDHIAHSMGHRCHTRQCVEGKLHNRDKVRRCCSGYVSIVDAVE